MMRRAMVKWMAPGAMVWALAAALGAQQPRAADLTAWRIQTSAKVAAGGAAISTPGFAARGWVPAQVPSTVFGALAAAKLVPNPYNGMNLRQAPGVEYKIGINYSHERIPADSPYRVPWWFRTTFTLPPGLRGKTVWLDFNGINYRADIWLNGRQIASQTDVRGFFRRYEFNVTNGLRAGRNALALLVHAPGIDDLSVTFVDWNPMPPDKDMGLWGRVLLRASGPVAIRHAWTRTTLDLPRLDLARVTVAADLVNATGAPQRGTLRGSALGQRFARTVTLAPHATVTVSVPLTVRHPKLWWPYGMGAATLHRLRLRFLQDGRVSDTAAQQFGMDEITSKLNRWGGEQFSVNGKPVYVRGGGWTPDMLLKYQPKKWALDFSYARQLGLNTVRLEGKMMGNAFFDLADKYGILVMAGWCCCDHWQEWPKWKDGEEQVATASLRDQTLRLRGHASLLVWLDGSDIPPPAPVERAYLDVLKQVQWPKPILSSASATPTTVTGPSGVKMTGPYDYVPPVYWLAEPQLGGARGFNTETSMGAAIPPVESLRRFIPADHLWDAQGALDPYWSYHAGSGEFLNLKRYLTALTARYGAPTGLHDFVWKSAAMSYEGERAMFEAFGRKQGEATGVVQWMLDNGWPSLIWHLYDYYLRPGPGFYGVERANEPLHIQYSDFDREVSFVNHTLAASPDLEAEATVTDLEGRTIYTHRAPAQAGAESDSDLWKLPTFAGDTFVELRLLRGTTIVSRNFYWLSAKPDEVNLKSATWYYAPETSSADFTALAHLPKVRVEARAQFHARAAEGYGAVRLENASAHVALLVRLRVMRGGTGHEVLPVWWQDNYISLLPGERRTVEVRYRLADLRGAKPELAVDGWNVARGR
jgi:exo-1,4-beta-D-glucosaminidase